MLRNLGEFVGNFGNQSKTGAGETAKDSADETTDHAETRIKVQRKKAAAPSFFQKLSSTQQAVALLAVVAILVVVLLCALLPNKKIQPRPRFFQKASLCSFKRCIISTENSNTCLHS